MMIVMLLFRKELRIFINISLLISLHQVDSDPRPHIIIFKMDWKFFFSNLEHFMHFANIKTL